MSPAAVDMANAHATPLPPSIYEPQLIALAKATSALEAKSVADAICLQIKKTSQPLQAVLDASIVDVVLLWASSKSGYERESAGVLIERLCKTLGEGIEGVFLPLLPALLNLMMDKGQPVRSAIQSAITALIKICPPEATRQVLELLGSALNDLKGWRSKVAALKAMEGMVRTGEDGEWVALEFGHIIPVVEHAMHDTKTEVSAAAVKAATTLCSTLPNADLLPHVKLLVSAMASPSAVSGTIKTLSSTTFVAEVNAPTLAVMVPLLQRALKERSTDTQRMTNIVIGNLVKLVREPDVAARYLSPLVPGVETLAKGAAFPEIRAFAQTALDILLGAGASSTEVQPAARDIPLAVTEALTVMMPFIQIPGHQLPARPSLPLSASLPNAGVLAHQLEYQGGIIADLVELRRWDAELWAGRCLASGLKYWLPGGKAAGLEMANKIRDAFMAIDKAKFAPDVEDDGSEGELLCDIQFSLAYGGLLLLNHTNLKLRRGKRYGICAGNGQGKSTLMKAIRDGKVEGFPAQDQLRTIMVEHALQGEDTSMKILDFVVSDENLKHHSREKISETLFSVGFSHEKQADPVASLSGGWKMKLELARAILIGADILLLDEPTNHLDVASVAWLENWLCDQHQVTSLIVSHDSGFLDNVCTDIIHYEQKKLAYYPGNLAKFVEKVPAAKSYYTLAESSAVFTFPPPGSLMGVRSQTRAIMKLSNCTFTYPGAPKPSLKNVSCALTLSSRVGILGPNGAGKSTLIKLLTGETIPQEGKVDKHPALRVGYVAQHAFHHLDQHLEKTPVGYSQWRYQDGHDREMSEKATRSLTDEDIAQMEIEVIGKNGEARKIEALLGRQKLKKTFQYEVKWRGLQHKDNTWMSRDALLEKGFGKLVQGRDDLESSREGAGARETSAHVIRDELVQMGIDEQIAMYSEIKGLSGGQKVKLVISSALFNKPHVLVLDEPTNFLDREALGGLSVAIKNWGGAILIISHNMEFVNALCPEIWHVDNGELVHKGKVALIEDAFDNPSRSVSQAGTPRSGTPRTGTSTAAGSAMTSAATSAANSEDEGGDPTMRRLKPKKKKLTRNEVKAGEARRAARKLKWLIEGGEREPDTDAE